MLESAVGVVLESPQENQWDQGWGAALGDRHCPSSGSRVRAQYPNIKMQSSEVAVRLLHPLRDPQARHWPPSSRECQSSFSPMWIFLVQDSDSALIRFECRRWEGRWARWTRWSFC